MTEIMIGGVVEGAVDIKYHAYLLNYKKIRVPHGEIIDVDYDPDDIEGTLTLFESRRYGRLRHHVKQTLGLVSHFTKTEKGKKVVNIPPDQSSQMFVYSRLLELRTAGDDFFKGLGIDPRQQRSISVFIVPDIREGTNSSKQMQVSYDDTNGNREFNFSLLEVTNGDIEVTNIRLTADERNIAECLTIRTSTLEEFSGKQLVISREKNGTNFMANAA